MSEKIAVYMDANEKSSERHIALAEVLTKNLDRWFFEIKSLPLDLCFELNSKRIFFELKEIEDLWSSMSSGHLGLQARIASELNCPCFVGVLGSLDGVLDAGPRLTKRGYKGRGEQINDVAMMRGFLADLFAANFAPMFLSDDLPLSMQMITSMSRRWLLGGNLAEWMPRAPNWQEYCLLGLPGIGEQKASDLSKAGIGVKLSKENRHIVTPVDLTEVRGIGPVLADKILDATASRQVMHRRQRARFVPPED